MHVSVSSIPSGSQDVTFQAQSVSPVSRASTCSDRLDGETMSRENGFDATLIHPSTFKSTSPREARSRGLLATSRQVVCDAERAILA
jgi:hypothetical protein